MSKQVESILTFWVKVLRFLVLLNFNLICYDHLIASYSNFYHLQESYATKSTFSQCSWKTDSTMMRTSTQTTIKRAHRPQQQRRLQQNSNKQLPIRSAPSPCFSFKEIFDRVRNRTFEIFPFLILFCEIKQNFSQNYFIHINTISCQDPNLYLNFISPQI